MKSVKNEFPNPVLASGRDDYIESCCFFTSFDENEITVDSENISFSIKYTLQCAGLESMVKNEQAVAVVLIKSSAASYSKLFRFPPSSTELNISIPKYDVVSKMDIYGSIIAADNIPQFRCDGEFNELYFGTSTFEIRKGDILATEDSRSIFVDDSELERPISSIFDISRNDEQDSDVVPNFYGQKIEIFLKSELYDLYYKFRDFNNGALRRYAAGVIVYPVLVEAIMYITGYYQNEDQGDGTDLSEKRWFRAIDHKADVKGINLQTYQDSPTTLANDLLGDIALDALKSFKDTLDSEINSGETEMIGGVD
ncbi:hypothetical protein [Mogibacterium timidum]|uniref:hypothetical protein n=1 Tax=Mogibacterium timidum TaxID=35519 RepID=UPI0023566C81|nr:hypothetical protein [Mogibacterium timidum]